MRDYRLDVVARQLATSGSRRSLIHRLGAAALAGLPGIVTRTGGADAATARCQKLAKPCAKRKKCCPGLLCRGGRCQCPASKRACDGGCIARNACCPKTEISCRGGCLPKGSPCCGSGEKVCRQQCIPERDCCDSSECTGECLTGTCTNGRCDKLPIGTECAEPDTMCNSQGVCNVACVDNDSCPDLEHTTPQEYCRRLVCVSGVCEETDRPAGSLLPPEYQGPADCTMWECDLASHNKIAISFEFSRTDPPTPDNPCQYAVCGDHFGTWTVHDHNADYSCPGGTCDGNGTCVPSP